MTHLALDIVTAFFAGPAARSEKRRSDPEGNGGLPLVFILFSLSCVALSLFEAWRAPLGAAAAALEQTLIPQL